MATTSQSTISAGVTAKVKSDLEENLRARLAFAAYTEKGEIDKGHGTLIFSEIDDLAESATTLADDGTNPTSEALALTTYTVTPSEIGRVVSITRRARAVSPYDLVGKAADVLGYDGKRRIDTIVSTAAIAGGTARFSGSATTRGDVTANLLSTDVRKWAAKLQSMDAQPFDGGMYPAITDPFVLNDLISESGGTGGSFIDATRYAKPEAIARGVVGKVAQWSTEFILSTQSPVVAGAGSGGVDVYITMVLTRGFLGMGRIEGLTGTYVPPTPSHANPLGRVMLVGYRLDMGATALNAKKAIRFESAATSL